MSILSYWVDIIAGEYIHLRESKTSIEEKKYWVTKVSVTGFDLELRKNYVAEKYVAKK